ncbi:MAG: PRC-barrel domain-containing protein [Rhodospirillales bacterium]|nr:PRC-barrel domain-containing protein [Rhodospirillales bacterium]
MAVAVLAAASALAQTAAPVGPDTLEQVSENKVVAVLGLAARGGDGKEIGRIVDVLVDEAGRPRAAVIDVGGFLGMGNRKVAVDWGVIRFTLGKAAVATLRVPSEVIKSAPAYDPAKPVEAVGLPEPVVPPAAAPAPPAPPSN